MPLADLLQKLDPRPDIRGRQFERICKWYLESAPEYRGKFSRVWLWSEWPDAWAADAGIDLVAEEHDGGLWAIQAKAYDPQYAIKKADVDSFLSESSRSVFTYRLLIATTDRLGSTARRTLDDQREPVGYLLRSQLELAQVSWPASPDELRPRRPRPKEPFPHVKDAIKETITGFKHTERGRLIMACGTGKTLAAMWIAERLDSARTLVLVPSLSLLAQTLREWTANATKPFDYLAVCSDETVTGVDELVEHTSELGLPVTTDPTMIAAFLRRRGRRVVFATYQSSPQIAVAYTKRIPHLDLAIADEAHRTAGRVSSDFATILDAERIKARRRMFMTATPRLFTPRVRREAGQLDVEVASMDDEAVYGPVLHLLTFSEAIERKLLSDYQVVVVGVDDETYHTYAERGEFVTTDGKKITDARSLGAQIGLAKTIRKYDLRRVISFHGRVKAAKEFSTEMPEVIAWMPAQARPTGRLWSQHVSGAMSSGHRDRLLLRFRGLAPSERGLLSNARCLGEGVDVPSIDAVAFIDPRHSTIDIVQALGRAIRKSAKKTVGTIVVPVFLSEAEDPNQVLDESAFKHVWDVLKALRAHDEALGDELDALRRRLGAQGSAPRRPRKIELDVPASRVGAQFVRAFNARLVEQTTASWEFYYGLLERFIQREGHPYVPWRHTEAGFRLNQWVNVQRQKKRLGTLSPDHIERLDRLGFDWEPWDSAWERGYQVLQKFVAREGNSLVPDDHVEGDYRLGAWVGMQRVLHSQGRLAESRQARLEKLPDWTWDARKNRWETGYRLLTRFAKREGHAEVPKGYCEEQFELGRWVRSQRNRYARGLLGADRVARLQAIPGWTWQVQAARWERAFSLLRQYIAREGDARVPQSHIEDGFGLGVWVAAQRRRSNRLSPAQHARLSRLPGWKWEIEHWSSEGIASAIRRWARTHGKPPTTNDWRQAGPDHPSVDVVHRHYGSWRAAIEAAGLKPRRRRWTEEEIVKAMQAWNASFGAPPRPKDWRRSNQAGPDHPTTDQVRRTLGSWDRALTSAGFQARPRPQPHRDRIISYLRANPGSRVKEIANALGLTPQTVWKSLSKLVSSGTVAKDAPEKYSGYSLTGRHARLRGKESQR